MLRKLMKYELKGTSRLLLPLYGILLFFSVINRLFFTMERTTALMSNFLAQIVMGITMFLYGCIVAAVFVVTFFVLIQRFYKNLLGDEGYLMNTLPVQSWKHIVTKMITAILWSIVSGIVVTCSILIMSLNFADLGWAFQEASKFFALVWQHYGISGYLLGFHILIISLLSAGVSILMVYASLAIGHIANKHKILCSFGVFLGFNFLSSFLVSTISRVLSHTQFIENLIYNIDHFSLNSILPFHTLCAMITGIVILFGVAFFFITNYVMSHRLNLE